MGNHTAMRARSRSGGGAASEEARAYLANPTPRGVGKSTATSRTSRTSTTPAPTPREREAERRATAAERTVSQHERTIATLQRQLAAARAENATLKAGGRGGTRQSMRAVKPAPSFAQLVPIGPVDLTRLTPSGPMDPYAMMQAYGRGQTEGVFSNLGVEELRRSAAIVARANPGSKPASRTRKADLIDYILAHLPAGPA